MYVVLALCLAVIGSGDVKLKRKLQTESLMYITASIE